MARAGAVWVDVLPNMSRFGSELQNALVEPVTRAADLAGAEGGEAVTSSMREKVKAGGAAVGLALGAAIASATVSAIEKEKVTDRLTARLGATGKGAQRAGKIAGALYSKAVTDSFEEAADVVAVVMGSGLIPEKATTKTIESLTTKVSDLAKTFDQDLTVTANAATQAIRTGMAKDAPAALDLITAGLQSGADKAGDFLETINEYSTQFRRLGLDGKTATGLLVQGLKGGARDADQLADGIGQFGEIALAGGSTVDAAFKSIGLSSKTMAKLIGAGGTSAVKALQMTTDALRGTEDKQVRLNAATDLFGDPGTVMGDALLSLNPASAAAAAGMDKATGAAGRLGKTIRGNTATELAILQRKLNSLFGTVVSAVVMPSINGLITAAKWTASVFAAAGRWFKEWGIWLTPLAIIIGGLTLALNANAIATGISIGVLSVYSLVVQGIVKITRAWAIVQGLFNAVMALNPITLVVIGLVALGAALVIAYKRSETFRAIVTAAWNGIKVAALWVWNNALKPAIDGFMIGLRAVGAAAAWLWAKLQPVFSAIGTAARILATLLVVIVVAPIVLAFKALAAVGSWLWDNALGPAFKRIAGGAILLWNLGVKPAFAAAKLALRGLGAAGMWLWDNALQPAFRAITGGAKLLWTYGIRPPIELAKLAFRALGAAGSWLWAKLQPVFLAIKLGAMAFYERGIKPALELGKRAIGIFPLAFGKARDAIKTAWEKISGIAKKPVNFIIDVVYNKGIVGVWNKVADAFGAPTLDTFQFARGGIMPGYTPGRDPHQFVSPTGGRLALSGGEAIMRPEWTRAVGPRAVAWMNRLARSGGASRIRQALAPALGGQSQAFAEGGIFSWIGKKVAGAGSAVWEGVKKGAAWVEDTLEASARAGVNAIVKPLLSRFPGADTRLGKMILGVPDRMVDALFGYSKEADGKGGSGGAGIGDALRWARSQAGKPYIWGGVGPRGFDCSGFMSAIQNVIAGRRPYSRLWATGAFSGATAPAGWVRGRKAPFMVGITNAGVGHTAGTLRGTNVESRGGDGVVVGARARGYRDRMFTDWYGYTGKGYANGGRPRAGELAWVGEQGPELVRFRGGEEVYSHQASLLMAQGLTLRGFAKGSSAAARKAAARARASARGQVPGDLKSFSKSLTGSASDIAKAANDLAKDLKAAGGAGVRLAKQAGAASTKLQDLAKKRDQVDAQIKAGKEFATAQRGKVADFLGLSNFAEAGSAGDVITGLRDRQGAVKQFQAQITSLRKRGLDKGLLGQLIEQGPGSALAGQLAGASTGQIATLNALAKSGAKLSSSYGNTMADFMFDAGKNASRGFLAGLASQEKELQAQMGKLGGSLVGSIKKALKIKSPSRRLYDEVGVPVGAGVVEAMADQVPVVAAQAERLAAAAVPATPVVPVTAGRTGTPGPGLQPGDRLRLVVGEQEMDAYVDDRVDNGLRDVHRGARTGSSR